MMNGRKVSAMKLNRSINCAKRFATDLKLRRRDEAEGKVRTDSAAKAGRRVTSLNYLNDWSHIRLNIDLNPSCAT